MVIELKTKGHYDFINLTDKVRQIIGQSGVKNGSVNLFAAGSTCSLTLMEAEEGIFEDFKVMLEKLAPETAEYKHHKRWGDHNGAAHLKSALIGNTLTIPFKAGELALGNWQDIIFIDFDERPRDRKVIVEIINHQ